MFFAVELGAILSALMVGVLFRKEKAPIPKTGRLTPVKDYVPTALLIGTIGLLIGASFAPECWHLPAQTNGIICCGMLVVGLICNVARHRRFSAVITPLKAIDLETLGLLVGLFLMIGGITRMGVVQALAGFLAKLGGGNVFLMYNIVVWASVLISAFIDNIPYVATMIPVIGGLAAQMAPGIGVDAALVAVPMYFVLLSGATLGGNMTPIGASANIAAMGILRKEGYNVKNRDFFRIGIPFTVAAIVPAYLYIWLVFG